MSLQFRKLKEDDEQFGHKAGDIVLVETEYDWDPEKVEIVAKLVPRNDHSFYKSQLSTISLGEIKKILSGE